MEITTVLGKYFHANGKVVPEPEKMRDLVRFSNDFF